MFNALPSDHPHPIPFTIMLDANVTPFVVNVNPDVDPDKMIEPVYVLVSPVAGSVTSLWMMISEEPASVTLPLAGPSMVNDFILMPPVTAFTVAV
jgi:hypothetical protein